MKKKLFYIPLFVLLLATLACAGLNEPIGSSAATAPAATPTSSTPLDSYTNAAGNNPGGVLPPVNPAAKGGNDVATATLPAATAMPATNAPANTASDFCPDRKWVNDHLFGEGKDAVVSVSTEDGAWQVNTGDRKNFFNVTLPKDVGLIATIHRPEADLAEVYVGDGNTYPVFRGTFRFVGCYSATDDMRAADANIRILMKENADGLYQKWANGERLENWQFSVIPGNFTCENCPSANVQGNNVSNQSDATIACPVFGGVQTQPGNDGAPYCKYAGSVVTDTVPTGFKAQYWDGTAVQYANSGSITTGEATFRPLQ